MISVFCSVSWAGVLPLIAPFPRARFEMILKRLASAGMLAGLLLGCSQRQQQQANEALDYGTGKTQVEAYQRVKEQVHAIRDDEARQLDDAARH